MLTCIEILCQVQAYLYDGYWEDIGTIEAFYNANLGITKKPVPDFRCVSNCKFWVFIGWVDLSMQPEKVLRDQNSTRY